MLERVDGGPAPIVRRVVPETEAPRSTFVLELDAPLLPGVSYLVGLAPLARAANGEPTSTAAIEVVGKALLAHTGDTPGQPAADLASPMVAERGQLRGLAPLDALKARLERFAATRSGAFTHAPSWGRSVEAKRTYSQSALAQEAAALASALRADPDVKAAEVRSVKDGHVSRFELYVEPRVGSPFVLAERIVAGGDS
jgi:hypothetical protein